MDPLLSIAAVFALAIPVAFVGSAFVSRGPDWIAAAFLPYRREDPWPRGVQEEDPSFTTLFRLRPGDLPAEVEEEPRAPTQPVAPRVTRRGRG
jgi:hypothetical protein